MKRLVRLFLFLPFVAFGSDGLVAWYKFDGDATDSSGNGNHGVVHGAILSEDRFGNANGAYTFDGDDDWIEVPHSDSLGTIKEEFTISFWIKPVDWWDKSYANPAIPFVCKTDTIWAEGSFRIGVEKDRNGVVTISGFSDYKSEERLTLGDWQHYVFVNGETSRLYRNGTLISSRTGHSWEIRCLADTLAIGRDIVGGVTQFLNGQMDDLRIYNRVLSAEEVATICAEENVDPTVYRTVTFNANGGTVSVAAQQVKSGAAVGELPVATRSGCEFLGWFTAAEGGVAVGTNTVIAADVTFYAHWRKLDDSRTEFDSEWTEMGSLDLSSGVRRVGDPIAVAYGANWFDGGTRSVVMVDGVVLSDEQGEGSSLWKGDTAGAHTFTHQVYDAQGAQVGETYTATLQWVTRSTITFMGNLDGVQDETRQYDNGFAYGALPKPIATGYCFRGWWTDIVGGVQIEESDVASTNVTLFAHWNVREYIPDVGETPTAADVASAVADATDPKVTANIDVTNYNDFRTWAGKVKAKGGSAAGAQGVMSAENAWMSYALGQGTLLDITPTDGDLAIESFEPAAESGKFDFTVSVKDIEVGSEATKENLKKVFGLEGAATLDGAAFSSDKVDIEFTTPVDGNVKFTAGPKDADAKAFFMKVKILP